MKEPATPQQTAPPAKQAVPTPANATTTTGATAPPPATALTRHLLWLQATAGNRAVSRLVQRSPGTGTVQREDEEKKTGIERIKEIHKNTWVGPLDEYELEDLWNELGAGGATQYPKEFAYSVGVGMNPSNLTGAAGIVEAFQGAVKNLALDYLTGNLNDLGKEERALGIGEEKPSPEADANIAEVVILAEKAKELDGLSKSYGNIQVGYNVELVRDPDDPEHKGRILKEVPALFTPGKAPEKPLSGREGKGARPYEEVLANYSVTMGGLMAIANKHPSIYAAYQAGTLDSITGKEGEPAGDPRAAVQSILGSTRQAVIETQGKVSGGGIGWEELKPIHGQLLRGERKAGGYDWASPWYKEIVKDEVGDYETVQTLIDLGIGLAAATAFIFSEIATGGAATVLWAGAGLAVGGGNVARKWSNYDDLKTAASAGTSSATELVSKDQVTAAAIDAIIESAFFFLDAVGMAVKGVKGAAALGIKKAGREAAEEAAGIAALKGLKGLAPEEVGAAAVKGIDQLGVKGAADAAGMSVEDLLKLVPADSSAAGKIKAFLKLAGEGVEASKLPAAIKSVLEGGEVVGQNGAKMSLDDVIKQAIDQLGFQRTLKEAGEWKALAAALGPASEAGQRMKAWRDAVYSDLKKYIESLRTAADGDGPLVKETGTLQNVTNDLDISFLGPRASENKTKAAQYLGGRTGFGADAKALDKMVYIGLFTDPRRMHLFDEFPELQAKLAKRTMKFEEELIWNDELTRYLAKAGKAGEEGKAAKELAEKIAAEMDVLGVKKIPGFKPIGERAVELLSRDQDRLHTAIEAALKGGDVAEAEKLMEELATIQAQINVKEGGGYFSAGGVRKFVTDKEGFPGTRLAATAAHDLGAALDQVNKLRKSIAAFEAQALKAPATRDATELAKHIKDLAKYGDRFASAAEVLGSKTPGGAALDALGDEFGQLILQARGATVHTMQELLARNVEGVIAKTRGAIGQFDQLHVAILQALRERAAIEGMEDLAPDILRATKVRYALLEFQAMLLTQMGTAARAVGIPIQDAVRDDDTEAGKAAEPSPEPKGDFPTPDKEAVPA